jgi:predicted DNA-binding protein
MYNLKKSKTIRLSESTVNDIAYLVNETKISESELLRSIIEKAIDKYKLKKAFEGIELGTLSISGGAKLAGLTYRDFYEKMIKNNIKTNINDTNLSKIDYNKIYD